MIPQDSAYTQPVHGQADTMSSVPHISRDTLAGARSSVSHIQRADSVSLEDSTLADSNQNGGDSLSYRSEWPVTIFGDTVYANKSLYEELNSRGEALPYTLTRDPAVMGVFLFSFLVLLFIFARSKFYLRRQARRFFLPSNNRQDLAALKTPLETYTPFIMSFVLCLVDGILLYAFVNSRYALGVGLVKPVVVLGVCLGVFVAYNLLRALLYAFVNWVFFKRADVKKWSGGFSFLISVETILFLPLIIVSLNLGWDMEMTSFLIVGGFVLMRLLLLYHSFRIFFPKIYGLLHLIAYLCTLELIPLLALWKVLQVLSVFLIEKI